ncbi:MAG: hypothetical protein ABI134_20125, partial [Byssovorax sp.]
MTKKLFLHALALSRDGHLAEAVEIVTKLHTGFVQRRITHHKNQPDHREAALRLESAIHAARQRSAMPVAPVPTASSFVAPLPPDYAEAPEGAIDFEKPEPFLNWVAAAWDRIPPLFLDRLKYMDVWAVVALGSLRLAERSRRPPVEQTGLGESGGASRFAHALGLDALSGGRESSFEEPTRTVRLTRVRKPSEIEPTAKRMASLVITDEGSEDMRRTVQYVLVELLRNVLQHSGDELGAVVAAQGMGVAQHRTRPMIQLAVADAGIGIPRSLYRA